MDRRRHDGELGRPQQHDRPRFLADSSAPPVRREIRYGRDGAKPARCRDLLGDRIGDDRRGLAGVDELDASFDRGDGCRRRRLDPARPARDLDAQSRRPAARGETRAAALARLGGLDGTFKRKRRARAPRWPGSATTKKAGAAASPCVAAQAFSASSGPIPEGSPRVSARQGSRGARHQCFTMTAFDRNSLSRRALSAAISRRAASGRSPGGRRCRPWTGPCCRPRPSRGPKSCARALSDARPGSCRAVVRSSSPIWSEVRVIGSFTVIVLDRLRHRNAGGATAEARAQLFDLLSAGRDLAEGRLPAG